jgi:hypothetical protein
MVLTQSSAVFERLLEALECCGPKGFRFAGLRGLWRVGSKRIRTETIEQDALDLDVSVDRRRVSLSESKREPAFGTGAKSFGTTQATDQVEVTLFGSAQECEGVS